MGLAYKFAAQWLWEKYSTVTSELNVGNLQHLPEVSEFNLNFL